jgi:polar amino acid transport system substrate-binding protein
MRFTRRPLALLSAAALVLAACAPAPPQTLLEKVEEAGKIVMSTDPMYPPQSFLRPDGTFEGFDIDVGTEIARRLGVDIEFTTPSWDVITAGSWGGRWDFSVGSMTITRPRMEVLHFSDPYYFTPAQMAASTESGITTLEGLAGRTICVGAATTYFDWMMGTLDLVGQQPVAAPPEGSTVTTLETDRLCAETWLAGRHDFEGWLSSATTVALAIEEGLPLVKVGEPVFYEPLAVAFDRAGPDPTTLIERVNEILAEMRADGTLTELSMKWFGLDLTVGPGV